MLSIVATRLRLVESLWGDGLHRLPAALKLIDIRDELQDFGGNSDVPYFMHDRISILTHFHPIPVTWASTYPFVPVSTHSFIKKEAFRWKKAGRMATCSAISTKGAKQN